MIKKWFEPPVRENTVIVEGPDMDRVMRTGLALTGPDGEWGVKESMQVTSKGFRIVLGKKTAQDHQMDRFQVMLRKDADEMLKTHASAKTTGTSDA